ncbi:DHA2 family efflux MFS transporter permease subunit [Ktedonosporobacter rubrisoli]|uniref:DHA2 family efflux MFS transporter permease subunit n=1 Tax=Ktedonosporobacter rubrisoli TaxID=2509675 RepID=A0A4P6JNC8_KTERU|nr:MFS transporter [Ktedonosporobacter rubrisoli]QBD76663.1 DHA2 family efflux MFS transporter permease subunit [Ktedonosporobacter rubrisoli]
MITSVSKPETQGIQKQHLAFVLLCLARFMVILDASIVNVALPSMQHDFGLSTADLQWVVSIYSLTFGSFLLLSGRAGDLFGRRRLFMGGLALFSLSSLAGGFAPSGIWFIVIRGIQGLGAALVAPTTLSLITTLFEEGPERNRAFGITGSISSLGFAIGALLGGLLVAGPGWRWVMFVNVPVGLLALILTPIFLPETTTPTEHKHIDVLGAFLVTAGLVALVYLLAEGNHLGWISGPELLLLLLSVLFLLAFVLVERRSREPLVNLSIFRLRNLTGGNIVNFFTAATFVPLLFILTLYMQQTLHYSALATGLAFLPMALTLMIISNIVSRQIARVGVLWLMIGGLLIVMLGLFLLTRISAGSSYIGIVLPGILFLAAGFGCVMPGIFVAATSKVASDEQGLASGLINTSQQIGGSVGMALVSTAIGARSAVLLQTSSHGLQNIQNALVGGFQAGVFVCIGSAFLAALLALLTLYEHKTPAQPAQLPEAKHCHCARPVAITLPTQPLSEISQ